MKMDNKKPTCPICGGSVLGVKGAVYDTDTCRKKGKKQRYKANRIARGLPGNHRSVGQVAKREQYKHAKFGEDYRDQPA